MGADFAVSRQSALSRHSRVDVGSGSALPGRPPGPSGARHRRSHSDVELSNADVLYPPFCADQLAGWQAGGRTQMEHSGLSGWRCRCCGNSFS